MQIAHVIDEVVFDLSFVSTCIADDHESKVSAWITGQILPAVDSVLNEFDEAKTVLRLDLVEVDLGDVTEEAFQAVLAQRLRERLSSMLQGIGDSSASFDASADNPSRVSYAQIDLERLQFFLTTGQMASHANTSSRQSHEQILERVLQENSDTFIRFLQQSTVKRTLIDRLVKQFSEPCLVNLLQKITPNHVALMLNLLEVYRVTITGKQFFSTTSVASIDALWVSVFDVVLDQSLASKDQATVTSTVVEKLMASSASDSAGVLKKMQLIATRLKLEKRIDAALPKLLTDVRERHRGVINAKDERKTGSRLQKKAQRKESAAQYQRIIQALKAAEIAEFRPLLKGLRKHSAKIRERLATQGKKVAVREQLAEKLTDDILLDITGLFIPTAVGYIRQLLTQTSRLHQGVGEEAWKQQLWKSHLSYLFVESHTAFVPTDYLKTVASLMSPTHDAESVLRVWCAELSITTNMQSTEQSLPNLLQQLMIDVDRSKLQEIEQHASDSDAYKTLIQRLQSGVPHDTQSLQPVIAELSQAYPEQWQRIHEAIRDGILSTAHLSVLEQQQLLIAFIDQAPVFNAENRAIFIQAVTSHAEGAVDPSAFYQQVLQALLHDKPVDLEAIQKRSAPDKNDVAVRRLKVDGAVHVKEPATDDRTLQYQRIVQALEETEIVGFYPLPEGLQQHPVMIRQLLAEHGKQAATRQQLAVRLTDKILLDITDLYFPAAVSYINQLLAQAGVLHQGVGEAVWKQQLWESNLSYLFTESNVAFIPADYLKSLARLMSLTNDAKPVLLAWYQILYTTISDPIAEHNLVNLLRQLIADEDGVLPLEIDQSLSSEAYKTLMRRESTGSMDSVVVQSPEKEKEEKKKTEDTRVTKTKTGDRTEQYQRIVQALKAVEVGGLQLSSKGLRRHPVKIRQLLATKGKQIAMQRQLAKKLADDVLLDITDLFAPAAVSYIKQLLVQSAVLHQGVGEAIWKQRVWESNLNYLFTEATPNFVPADYLKALGRLMSPSNDASSVLLVWHKQLSATTPNSQLAEQPLASLLQQLIPNEEAALTKDQQQSQSDSEAYKTLVQRLQQGASQGAQPLQPVMAELAQDHPQHLIRVYEAIRGGTLSTAGLNATDQRQLLTAFIDQSPTFNAENRVAFIQAIESQADHAIDHSTYYQLILQALLHDQPVDLVSLSEQTDSSQNFAVRGDELTVTDAAAESTDRQPLFDEYAVSASVSDIETKEMIEISNAGQVIAAPYLPRLFQMLKLLDDEGSFLSFDAAERAVHLLQFMVDEQSESPEYMLILNKVLCGIPTAIPIRRQMNLSEHEKKVVEDLIQGMIQNWKTIGNTSVSGFRQTFLQRDGGLLLEDDAWRLTVHPGTFDMLLDGLPWSFSIVKHAWMDKPIHVDWR